MLPSPPLRRAVAALAATAACLALAACGDDADQPEAAPTRSTLTAPGTTLALDEPATVPVGDRGVARLTVTRIEAGRPADLKAFGKDPGATVTYVWLKVAPLAGDPADVATFASYDHVHGWSGDDLVPHVLTDPRDYAPCPTRYFPGKGPISVLETCVVFTGPAPIDRVGFHDGGDYRRNADEISWR